MTLLSVARDVCDEVQIALVDDVAGNTDTAARRILRYANSCGKQIARDSNWQALRREHTFTAVAGEAQAGALPADFGRFVPGTFYDRTGRDFVVGPIPAAQWQASKAHSYSASERRFAYREGAVSVIPAFAGGEACAFEYVSSNIVEADDGTLKAAFTLNDDVFRIDEELLTLAIASAYLQSEGLPAMHMERRYQKRFRDLVKHDQHNRGTMKAGDIFGGSRQWGGIPPVSGSGFDGG